MPPTRWMTPEQAEFLTGLYPTYLEHTAAKSYHRFWAGLYADWFTKWPEREVLFPNTEGMLDAEQGEALGAAVDARKKQLQTWFRWRANKSRRSRLQQKKSSVFKKVVAPKGSRIRTPTELYMLEHYDDQIKPQIMAEQQAGNIPAIGNNLTAVRKYAQELLESEDGEIKDKIQLMYKMQERVSKTTCDLDSEEETDPAEIKRAIDDLLYALARVAKLVKRLTRFAISFVCAGPDSSRNWDISSISCHPDTTPEGCTFPNLFPKESNAMLVAFQEYAETIFPLELHNPAKSASKGEGGEVKEGAPIANEGTVGVPSEDEGCRDGDVAIEDSGNSMGISQTKGGSGPESENQCGAGDEGADDAEGEDKDEGGQEYGVAVVEGDKWQVTSDASRSFVGLDASFGTWGPSGTARPSPDQSTVQFNASMPPQDPAAIGFQSHFGLGLSSQAPCNLPQLTPVQSIPTFASGSGSKYSGGDYVSGDFSYNDSTANGISFSDAMRDITADLAGNNWDFSGIGLHSLGTLPVSDLHSTVTQFSDADTGFNAELLPLSPIPNNPSPVRPCLPAVPPPSPDEHAMVASSQQKPTKSRS
ncbi:hypothetical protein JVT61DRAFT_3396 [Boletus reticuloceps]|uniref:Uncharacterized protein n=1 Tax=Boletus reticuloceps TaxID=495285 RepID=A0A8I2YQR7_9AGAM|nr:hypothetical protein JVT61DRAFT_3396 [Boletus reticuloceps]